MNIFDLYTKGKRKGYISSTEYQSLLITACPILTSRGKNRPPWASPANGSGPPKYYSRMNYMIALLRCKSQTKTSDHSSIAVRKTWQTRLQAKSYIITTEMYCSFLEKCCLVLKLCAVIDQQPVNRPQKKKLSTMLSFRSSKHNAGGIKCQIAFTSEF